MGYPSRDTKPINRLAMILSEGVGGREAIFLRVGIDLCEEQSGNAPEPMKRGFRQLRRKVESAPSPFESRISGMLGPTIFSTGND